MSSSFLRAAHQVRPTFTGRVAARNGSRRNYHQIYDINAAKGKQFLDEQQAIHHHAASTASMWYKVSLYVALPLVTVALIRSFKQETEHISHVIHHAHDEPDEDLPPELPYQNIRRKDFFWGDGDKTMFWNDLTNVHRS
ncbi:cytochrome c oxidase, subunit VIa [Lipomyces tetrasporus]